MMTDWLIVGASVEGQSHLKLQIPCQDSFSYRQFSDGWGIAVVSDGAGSAAFAHIASKLIVQHVISQLEQVIKQWKRKQPTPEVWKKACYQTFWKTKQLLENYALQNKWQLRDLSATVLSMVYSPHGVYSAHIGDGRAAFLNQSNEWKALIKPWKGEYSNETVFITSDIWEDNEIENYLKCSLVEETPQAFALLTDGMERHSFICNTWDEKTDRFYDPNTPFDKFFNPLVSNLKNMQLQGLNIEEITEKWTRFLQEGNEKLKNEPDDKTMILGVKL